MESSHTKHDEIGQNNKISNIKADYFLVKLFGILTRKRTLKIIKYNKKIKPRLNININDYEDYSKIEIEIKPVKNKYGKFINIEQVDEPFYHIYFDNSKEEIKRYFINENDKVSKIRVLVDYQIKSFYKLFMECECIEAINFKTFYRKNINNMSYMFCECKSIKEMNLSNFITDNVLDMSYMFYYLPLLQELNLSNFNTKKVTNMNCMFFECPSLKKLDLANFDNTNVTNMSCMFMWCTSLKEINFPNFIPDRKINMWGMFDLCPNENELKKKLKLFYDNI